MAPELTIGFVRPSALTSTAASELKAIPVALAPTRERTASQPIVWQTSASRKRFGYAHDREWVLRVAHVIDVAAGTHDAEPEQRRVDAGERGIDLRHLAIISVGVQGVRLGQNSADIDRIW